MRQDNRVLLDRLGEERFKYYEFESPSLEVDIWPIFEAILLDERVVGKLMHQNAPEPAVAEHKSVIAESAELSERSPRLRPVAGPLREPVELGMFVRYSAAIATPIHGRSVRDTLGRLALDRA